EFTASDYQDFLAYLKKSGFEYHTQTEEKLKTVFEFAHKEELDDEIKQEYEAILAAIENSNQNALKEKKPGISSLLTDEIIKRYFYQEGLYQYYVKHNPEIMKAKEVLSDSKKYAGILN